MPITLPPPERALVQAFNLQRAAYGLPALRIDRRLTRAAEKHSRDLVRHGRLGHASSDGTPFARRIARVGRFSVSGEVLAFAPGSASTARAVVRMFMRSPPHRAELLNPRYRLIGVGRVRGGIWGTRGAVVTADLATR